MKVSEINHFKCVQAAKAVHGSDSMTGPYNFYVNDISYWHSSIFVVMLTFYVLHMT